ncbi:MAG: alpha/beta fold hydrolase [Candidatus Hydrogenedentes bacterium]|nr:alpha/beta fold hydrolase [Candidatus Hydrogenedentota bacterium]
MADCTDSNYGEAIRRKAVILDALSGHPYRCPWWLSNGHAQTMFATLVRRPLKVETRRVRWDTPDEDFIDLHFRDGNPDQPVVLILHGLEGSAQSKYVRGLHRLFTQIGWTSVAMEFRGCGSEMNRAPRLYHSGETTDLALVAQRLAEDRGALYAVGISLGGNVLAKWLGELGDAATPLIHAAAVVSAPFDLTVSGPHIDQAVGGAYARHFLKKLIAKAIEKERQYPGIIDIERARRCRTLYEFDDCATAVLHGFSGADEYWRTQGCGQFLGGIRVPTMLLSSADDPFNPAETLPRELAASSAYLYPQFTERGGHVGFVYGATPWTCGYWAEEQVARYFKTVHEYREAAAATSLDDTREVGAPA